MKKVLSILITVLILAFLIVPASADEIDGNLETPYYFNEIYTGLYELYKDPSVNEGSGYVFTDEFFSHLDYVYSSQFKNSESYKNGDDFFTFLYFDGLSAIDNDSVKSVVEVYFDSLLTNDIKNEFENYKYMLSTNGNTVTAEGFQEYLQYNNITLYNAYIKGSYSISSEMFSAGAASSSSSGGSSGSTTPGENQGENYGKSHTNSNHEITDSDCCYNPGYNDGLLDGGDVFQNSEEYQTIINENKTEAVNNYLQSEEFLKSIENIKTESSESAVKEYLTGEAYQGAIDSAYAIGSENGYNQAYQDAASDVYELGKLDGFNEFRSSQECVNALDSAYKQGWKNGNDHAQENAINPGGVIILIVLVIAGVALLLILTKVEKKKRGK